MPEVCHIGAGVLRPLLLIALCMNFHNVNKATFLCSMCNINKEWVIEINKLYNKQCAIIG